MQRMTWNASRKFGHVPSGMPAVVRVPQLEQAAAVAALGGGEAPRTSCSQKLSEYIASVTACRATPRSMSGRPSSLGIGVSSSSAISASKAPSASPSLWKAHSESALHWARNGRQRASNPAACCRLPSQRRRRSGSDGPVEHGGPHRLGEHRRPGGAELAAVAEPEVADRLLAERLADRVHVACACRWCRRARGCPRCCSAHCSVKSCLTSTISWCSASSSGVMS